MITREESQGQGQDETGIIREKSNLESRDSRLGKLQPYFRVRERLEFAIVGIWFRRSSSTQLFSGTVDRSGN